MLDWPIQNKHLEERQFTVAWRHVNWTQKYNLSCIQFVYTIIGKTVNTKLSWVDSSGRPEYTTIKNNFLYQVSKNINSRVIVF